MAKANTLREARIQADLEEDPVIDITYRIKQLESALERCDSLMMEGVPPSVIRPIAEWVAQELRSMASSITKRWNNLEKIAE